MNETIFEQLKKCILNIVPYQQNIQVKDKLKEDLGIDSLNLVVLLTDIEINFNLIFDISTLSIENLQTVENLIYLIKEGEKDDIS